MGYPVQFVSRLLCDVTHRSWAEHRTMTKGTPPLGFKSRGWSEEIGPYKPTSAIQFKPDEVARNSPVPTQVTEDYHADGPGDCPAPPALERWAAVVDEFILMCDHLDETARQESERSSYDGQSRAHSRLSLSSRGSMISGGRISPGDDSPSKRIVHYDDHTVQDLLESSYLESAPVHTCSE